jgi:MFS family permease
MGLGGGFSEGTAMALMTDLYTGPRRTVMANWSQSMFGFGAIACPLAVGWLL